MSAPAPLYIGQRVRHTDFNGQRVTGVVRGLALDDDRLMVDCALDAPIVIRGDEHHSPIHLHRQYAPAHEFLPFDERDELIATLTDALRITRGNVASLGPAGALERVSHPYTEWLAMLDAAITKATGGAA